MDGNDAKLAPRGAMAGGSMGGGECCSGKETWEGRIGCGGGNSEAAAGGGGEGAADAAGGEAAEPAAAAAAAPVSLFFDSCR